ncbi:hypothetical protein GCM10029964_042550 [Kibdelosporangium lantanae]
MIFGRQHVNFLSHRTRRGLSAALAAVLAASLVTATAPPAAAAPGGKALPEWMKPLPHNDFPLHTQPLPRSQPEPPRRPPAWPAAGEADVDVTPARADRHTGDPAPRQRAGDLPVLLGAGVGRAHVRVADQDATRRAGVAGVMLSVGAFTGDTVGVDYTGFADAGERATAAGCAWSACPRAR